MKIDKFHRMGRGKPSPQDAAPLKMNISDMMDHVEGVPIEMEEGENVPIQGIQRAVRAKIREQAARPAARGRLPGLGPPPLPPPCCAPPLRRRSSNGTASPLPRA